MWSGLVGDATLRANGFFYRLGHRIIRPLCATCDACVFHAAIFVDRPTRVIVLDDWILVDLVDLIES